MMLSAEDTATARSRAEFVSRASPETFSSAVVAALTSCPDADTLHQVKLALHTQFQPSTNLHDLVFNFLSDSQRLAVLVHFQAIYKNFSTNNNTNAPRRVLVLSDIDDTLFPSFKDFRGFASGEAYPGAAAFLRTLCKTSENGVTFVTARPPFLMDRTRAELERIGFGNSLVLMGTSTSAVSGNMMEQKLKQAREIKLLWPECDIVLVGDNGQRDIDLGLALQREGLVNQVFIHDIYWHEADKQGIPPELDEEGRLLRASFRAGYRHEECAPAGIQLFSSYALASVFAKRRGLITSEEMEHIARTCAEEFARHGNNGGPVLQQNLLRDFGQVVLELDHLLDEDRVEFLRFILAKLE